MSEVRVGESGVVQSYTVLEMPPEGFEPPVVLALVELDDGPATLCIGSARSRDRLAIGTRVNVSMDESGRFLFSLIQ
ncbi:MAG: OB-fold domain-containing protein [Candidatus Thorarchaeota archaeon]|nr:OB-fold domain-containing protein [Candidatus Thorarchaeota archaeon]